MHFNLCEERRKIYVGSPQRKRSFEIASQRARAACSRWWRCVAGTLRFILTWAASRHVN